MLKSTAIELLGGTTTAAAEAIGVSYQAIDKWPMVLPRRIEDRVLAAQARKYLPAELLGATVDAEGESVPRESGNAIKDLHETAGFGHEAVERVHA